MGATLGIDLSSQPKNTAICLLEWSGSAAAVSALWRGKDAQGSPLGDELLISAMRGDIAGLAKPDKVAIDAPLGWPVDFVRGVSDLAAWPVAVSESRARLERRATDHWVHETTKKQPLSVTTDRIAYPAMRAAGLLAHYERASGEPVDRTGVTGSVCETYPDPSIRLFGLWPGSSKPRDSYKGSAADVREAIVDRLLDAAPWLELSPAAQKDCIEFDDCLDALICALVARAAECNKTIPPPSDLADEAALEGWIHVPARDCLSDLL